MTDGFDPVAVPVRPAATVMLVRDGDTGLEVFMLRRTDAAVFAAGMYVFPGGKVDAGDVAMEAWCDGRTDAEASRILRIPAGGLGYWVAAIRECFEEAGVLLARDAVSGRPVAFDDAVTVERFGGHRRAVHAGRLDLAGLCAKEHVRLATDAIGYVSHWITPVGSPRRFDARFFVALAPPDQEPLHDDHETVDSLWVRPADALARFERGDLGMFPPTVANLQMLAACPTAAVALDAVHDAVAGEPIAVLPKVRVDGEGRVVQVLMPGDLGYADAPEYAVVD